MKIDRLIGILSILLQKDKVTAAELAEKFEVSRRTIVRDIEDLGKAGIPVAASQGRGGGISVMEGFKLDRTLLSEEDMKAILTGLQGLDSVSESSRYRRLMDKLDAENAVGAVGAGNSIIVDLSSWDKNAVSPKLETIKQAAEGNKKISFMYYSPERTERREIEPYRLVFQWASWYVWGFCTKRNDYRMFKLTRMTDLTVGEKFAPREIPDYTCDKLRHTRGEIAVRVKFDSSVKWRLVDEFGAEYLTEDEDGSITLDFTWSDVPSFYSYIAGFRDAAEIIAPEEYRKEFSELLEKMLKKYKF
ncbi:MAG: YafY family transcriptional regulator [Oscillospiraceae bacterium]|nr:YafY family transcriptional regulator [Oscillospiraceae bacterium]